MKRVLKIILGVPLIAVMRLTRPLRENLRRIYAHASLSSDISGSLPASLVALGKINVYGSGDIRFGENVLLYPDLHLETQEMARILIGDGVVISRGTHIVAMAGISIGAGSMIGEFTSIRDANHLRAEGVAMREAGHSAKPITIGREVWIGRGVTVLGGVIIGDGATVGANAVVTRDVPAGIVVAGVPAAPIRSRMSQPQL